MRDHIRLGVVILAIIAVSAIAWQALFGAGPADALVVTAAQGARVQRAGRASSEPVAAGVVVEGRDQLVVGTGGHAILELGQGTRMELGADASVRVLSVDARGARVELEGGRLEARVTPGSPVLGVESRGRAVVATDAAFTVGVDADGTLAVRPETGRLSIEGVQGVTSVAAGERLTVPAEGTGVIDEATRALLLSVDWPDGAVREPSAPLTGRSAPHARVEVRSPGGGVVTTRADDGGRFALEVSLEEGPNPLEVVVSEPIGGEQQTTQTIVRDSQPPSATTVEVGWGP